jgi:hypothetical protein
MPSLYDACLNDRHAVDVPAAAQFQVSGLSDYAGRRLTAQHSRAVKSASAANIASIVRPNDS